MIKSKQIGKPFEVGDEVIFPWTNYYFKGSPAECIEERLILQGKVETIFDERSMLVRCEDSSAYQIFKSEAQSFKEE